MRKIKFYLLKNGRSPITDFLDSLTEKQVEKVFFVLDLIETIDIVPRKFFKKLDSTDGIWEVRVRYANNIFRLLGFFDDKELVILNHAFTKKHNKFRRKKSKSPNNAKKNIT